MKIQNKNARVSLVGAGPGDIELITVKGLKAIQSADAILYDALVDKRLLDEAPNAIKIFVGKRAGLPCKKQEDINLLIVENAYLHGHVVRLKGGDPFIFGRGHEELNFVENFGIPVEIVPGISSSTSLPLLEKIPVTRRNMSESFWVLTGSTKNHQLSNDIRLAAKSTATMVILMGIRKLNIIVEILRSEGKSEMPVMIIQNGSKADQKTVAGTIDTISSLAAEHKIGTPGIIVIGEVVSLHPSFINQKVLQYVA